MADKQVKTEQNEANEIVEKAKGFWAKYSKTITIVGTAVIVVLGGWFGYKKFISEPNEAKANDLIFPAEKLFVAAANNSSYNKDTVNMILNGDKATGVTGLLKIAGSYSGTKSGNRAQYIIGACYLNLGQYDKAIEHLKKFDANGASQIESKAYMLLGHAYAQQKKTDDAFDYYKKAATISGLDEAMATEAYYMSARYAESLGKTSDAIELFKKLKDEYPASARVSSGEVDKYLASLGEAK